MATTAHPARAAHMELLSRPEPSTRSLGARRPPICSFSQRQPSPPKAWAIRAPRQLQALGPMRKACSDRVWPPETHWGTSESPRCEKTSSHPRN
eukprot:2002654-Pyramimonas_sp.AAC.1